MPVVYPELQHSEGLAVIRKMKRLMAQRYCHEISRTKFMHEYDKLRTELNETEEYKALRRFAIARAAGQCEKCKQVPGNQMCHKVGVSFRPDLALRKDNVYWGCDECHQADHPELKLIPRTTL